MEATVEQRVEYLEERVKTLETMLEVKARPVPSLEPYPAPQTPRSYPSPPSPKSPPRPEFDLEELLGGRVLGWAGGVAVFIAAVFFVVMAVRNGWIGVEARMLIAFAASTGLVAFGAWLHERRGRMQVARAIVAAGLASLYASTAAATLHYHLISPTAGLVIAGAVGVAAFAAAVRWNAQEIAGIGIVGSLLAPVLVGTGTSTSALVFMAIALVAAIGVVVERGWVWLTAVAYVVSVPQAAAWLSSENDVHLGVAIAVAAGFWLLYVAAAVGYELLNPAEEDELRYSTASLLLVNAVVAAAGGWFMIDNAGHRAGANAWLFALAGAHVVLGMFVLASQRSREIALLLYAVGAAVAGIAFAVALDGPALVAAWSARRFSSRGSAAARACRSAGLSPAFCSRWPPACMSSPSKCGRMFSPTGSSRSRPPSARLPSCSSRSLVSRGPTRKSGSRRRGLPRRCSSISRADFSSDWPERTTRSRRRRRSSRFPASGAALASPRSSPGSSGGSERSGSRASVCSG